MHPPAQPGWHLRNPSTLARRREKPALLPRPKRLFSGHVPLAAESALLRTAAHLCSVGFYGGQLVMTSQEASGDASDDLRRATQGGGCCAAWEGETLWVGPHPHLQLPETRGQKHLAAQRAAPPLPAPASCCAVTHLLLCQAVARAALWAGRECCENLGSFNSELEQGIAFLHSGVASC